MRRPIFSARIAAWRPRAARTLRASASILALGVFILHEAAAQTASPSRAPASSTPFENRGRTDTRTMAGNRAFSGTSLPGGRSSLAGWRAFSSQKAEDVEDGTFRLGAAAIQLTLATKFEFDSNVNLSGPDPIWDLSVTPRFTIAIRWPVTRQNELNLQLGIEYRRYLIHPEFDSNGFVIDPGTVLEYRIYTGDFVFTVYDSPAIYTDAGGDPGLFNTVDFRQLDNALGITVLQDLNKLINTLGVERRDIRSLSGSFSSNDRTTWILFGSAFYAITPTTNIGLRGAITQNEYIEDVLNDSFTALGGVVLSSALNRYTHYYLETGVQSATFSDNGTPRTQLTFTEEDGFNEDVEGTLGGGDYLQPYFRFSIVNRLNRYIEHSLAIVREARGSTVSNYTENNAISYSATWKMNRFARLNLLAEYEFGKISATTSPVDYARWHSRIDVSYDIARDISVNFFYDCLINDLSAENGSYNRQRVGMAAIWTF